ncbi:MAG: helix-turn-helix domain-containing protein [Rhodospirillaceae bacterium]|nr:helix-turn-helix domain-containing protein [Rhodospirillaceae bacterium]MDE0363022.1 helix-turn-helix domain-containing protein [Rhodospirillaceae bacterium]
MSEEWALLTTRQAAARLGLSPRTLERYRVTGGGPEFVKMGHAVRYRIAKLSEWLERCARRSTSDDGEE